MKKNEFEKQVGEKISQEDFKIIETVCNWHPSIVYGEKQIIKLYKESGMCMIKNMSETAEAIKSIENIIDVLEKSLSEYKERKGFILNGNLNIERCIHDIFYVFNKYEGEEYINELNKIKNKYDNDVFEKALELSGIKS